METTYETRKNAVQLGNLGTPSRVQSDPRLRATGEPGDDKVSVSTATMFPASRAGLGSVGSCLGDSPQRRRPGGTRQLRRCGADVARGTVSLLSSRPRT